MTDAFMNDFMNSKNIKKFKKKEKKKNLYIVSSRNFEH